MPILGYEPLETLAREIFQAIRVPRDGAAWMAKLLVRANLRGHDSHGVIRIPQYIASWRKGEANPTAEPQIVQEGPATALMDGNLGFGQIVARHGMEVAMEKAAAVGVSTVGVFNSNHIGRLADYTEMALARDMLAMLAVNAGGAGQRMAPWGGRAPRLSTNPIAFACPAGSAPPISFDIATTVAAEGKVRVKRNRKEQMPLGWVLDAEGRPTGDPNALYGNPPGTILPAGGHKGYCLALMIEVLGDHGSRGILEGTSGSTPERGLHGRRGYRALRPARHLPRRGGRSRPISQDLSHGAGNGRDPHAGRARGDHGGGAPPVGNLRRGSDLAPDSRDRAGVGGSGSDRVAGLTTQKPCCDA